MSIIIPYDNKIELTAGAFIKPDGEIIYTNEDHETFAFNYCCKSNSLKKENLLLFKRWLMSHKDINRGMLLDFMTLVLKFDKADAMIGNVITTTDDTPHIKYYNYYLMDWCIDHQNGLIYNEETGKFETQKRDNFEYNRFKDMEVKEELDDIKKKVLAKDRSVFFIR